MEQYKISKLLNSSSVSKFVTEKWVEVNDLSSSQYSINKNIRFKTYFNVKIRFIMVSNEFSSLPLWFAPLFSKIFNISPLKCFCLNWQCFLN